MIVRDRGLDCSCDLVCYCVLFVRFFGQFQDGLLDCLLAHVS